MVLPSVSRLLELFSPFRAYIVRKGDLDLAGLEQGPAEVILDGLEGTFFLRFP